ncbi:hypothetical protein MPTK1_5g13990 [Marchantia polymorpha subsp. ruderalis]|uniref:Rubredoxin-like domain-containing protein n=2 Tax=Marchantia polymorpha TaxID=3197 RepID=A0A176WMS1_MARPO|nr:hypothetical protein AXG93_1054s1450 [Marchantia polymorpha subsp. ruderalis]PTQ41902.1 hypothetical protein MARPO_0032s0089 [Marchantia polymorpha]BBN11688.1 hypothetical protein Mp_5g13990 [Marchantia polymorpha subsp. ruderalis]|eukprot:PTQ41902.1 hypothetical protein MARPO_0032s0089 [Marchantia polymorpha]
MAAVVGLGWGVCATGALRVAEASSRVQSEKAGVIVRAATPQQQQRLRSSNGGLVPKSRIQRLICKSVDVDDSATEAEEPSVKSAEAEADSVDQLPNPRRGLEERFAVINTGKFECRSCGYVYDAAKGDTNYPIAAGIEFGGLPEDWRCPTCGAAKTYFQSKSVEIAGFAQNQQFGLGGNSLTEGQKSLLIYGTFAFFFTLFLAGYLLQ